MPWQVTFAAWWVGYLLACAHGRAGSRRLAAVKLGFTEVERFEAGGAEQWFGMRSPVTPPGGKRKLTRH